MGGEGVHFKNSYRQEGVQFSYEIILGGYGFHTPHFSENPRPPETFNKQSFCDTHSLTNYKLWEAISMWRETVPYLIDYDIPK